MASRTVNKVILLGHLGKDAELKFSADGNGRATFTLATNHSKKDGAGGYIEETDWHNCILFKAEAVAPFLLKGKKVYVEGRLQTRSYDDKEGVKRYITEVLVNELILLSDAQATASGAKAAPSADPLGVSPDDVPF